MVWWLKYQPQEPHVPSLASVEVPLQAPFFHSHSVKSQRKGAGTLFSVFTCRGILNTLYSVRVL